MATNVQESGVDFTTVETEASNEHENLVWVRPQRNRGIHHDGTVLIVHLVMFSFHWKYSRLIKKLQLK